MDFYALAIFKMDAIEYSFSFVKFLVITVAIKVLRLRRVFELWIQVHQLQIMSRAKQQEDKLLDEFLKVKPSRAIDRLLSEHPIQRAYALHNNLQERIKRNTSQLRNTLTEKYENLVDCSNLLSSIKNFTDQIQTIERNIAQVLCIVPSDSLEISQLNHSKVGKIEHHIYQKKYSQAIELCKGEGFDECERLYLPYLKMQIVEAVEEEIFQRKFTSKFIVDVVQCLKAFVSDLSFQEWHELLGNDCRGSLFNLIAEGISAKGSVQKITENDIIQMVFKCKLFSLGRPQKKEEEAVSKFFHDILQLLSEDREGQQISHLCEIFCKNLNRIQAHLLETFITKTPNNLISFRYKLYESLVTSQEFMGILQQLNAIIAVNYKQAPTSTLRHSFTGLWENYYNQLVQLLFNRINPVLQVKNTTSNKSNIPKQIDKFVFGKQAFNVSKMKEYEQEIKGFICHFELLLKETSQLCSSYFDSKSILQAILDLYSLKISGINDEVIKFTQEISLKLDLDSLRQIITLYLYCEQFNSKVREAAKQGMLNESRIKQCRLVIDCKAVKTFSQCFFNKSNKITQWSINFDHFFMQYYSLSISAAKKQIIKNVILQLLEASLEAVDKQRSSIFLADHHQRRLAAEKESNEALVKLLDLSPHDVKPSTFTRKKAVVSDM